MIPASSISYHANGMVNQVAHANGVTDTQAVDTTNWMGWPLSISATGANANWSTGTSDKAGFAVAHPFGVAAQQAVSGYTRLSGSDALNTRNTGPIVGTHQRGNDTVTVTFQFINGNLVRVTRRP